MNEDRGFSLSYERATRSQHPVAGGVALEKVRAVRGRDWRTEKIREYLDSHAGNLGLNLHAIVQNLKLEISVSHTTRLFKRDMGVSLRKYAKEQRLVKGATRLKSSAQSIKQVAAELGYKDTASFIRAFEERFQLTPTEFRHLHREQI